MVPASATVGTKWLMANVSKKVRYPRIQQGIIKTHQRVMCMDLGRALYHRMFRTVNIVSRGNIGRHMYIFLNNATKVFAKRQNLS